MRVVVVRHGETDWNLNGRMQGHAPVPLNATGREQADRVGRYVAREYDVERIVASDLLRTRETAELVGEHVDAPVAFDRAWRERDLGVYQGLTYGDIYDRFPEFALSEAAVKAASEVPEGGESLVQVRERVLDGWRALPNGDDGDDTTVLVVTHGGPIYLLLGYAKGMDVEASLLSHSQANCGVNEFEHLRDADGGARVVRENVTEWDDGSAVDGTFTESGE